MPAAWDAKGCELMREAAISAGLVQQFSATDRNWADRLHIITYGMNLAQSGVSPHAPLQGT